MATELDRLVEEARIRGMSAADREEQRINFAYGNAPESDKKSTKDSVRAASKILQAS